jgi:hypothetical protein
LFAVALPDLKGALGGSLSDSRFAHISAVLSVDSQQRQGPETGKTSAASAKFTINRSILNLVCQHNAPEGRDIANLVASSALWKFQICVRSTLEEKLKMENGY